MTRAVGGAGDAGPSGADWFTPGFYNDRRMAARLVTGNIAENHVRRPQKALVVILLVFMRISDVYMALGQDALGQLIRGISIGKLRTYQIYEGFKVRARLHKLNTESLRKSVPKFWDRIGSEDEFGRDLAQAILVSHLDLIAAVLDFLGVPHENGFFAKDMDAKPYFTDGWENRVFEQFRTGFSEPLVLFYINHLRWELMGAADVYRPAA